MGRVTGFDATRWDAYNAFQVGRPPRDLCRRVMALAGPGAGRHATDVGAGAGVESAALLADGWRVLALDPAPGTGRVVPAQVPPSDRDRLEVRRAGLPTALPATDLVHASFALPFVPPDRFAAAWAGVRDALRPGGWLAATFLGPHDSWAGDADLSARLTFTDERDLDRLLGGLEVLDHRERRADGSSFGGPKHWHTHEVVARRARGHEGAGRR